METYHLSSLETNTNDMKIFERFCQHSFKLNPSLHTIQSGPSMHLQGFFPSSLTILHSLFTKVSESFTTQTPSPLSPSFIVAALLTLTRSTPVLIFAVLPFPARRSTANFPLLPRFLSANDFFSLCCLISPATFSDPCCRCAYAAALILARSSLVNISAGVSLITSASTANLPRKLCCMKGVVKNTCAA